MLQTARDYCAGEGEHAEPELCHLIKEEFVRKLCELIREPDSNLTKSLRKSPAAVMSYCVPCLGEKVHESGAVLTVENDLDKLLGNFSQNREKKKKKSICDYFPREPFSHNNSGVFVSSLADNPRINQSISIASIHSTESNRIRGKGIYILF